MCVVRGVTFHSPHLSAEEWNDVVNAVNELGTVQWVLLSGESVDDLAISSIAEVSHLYELRLCHIGATADGLGQLQSLDSRVSLYIGGRDLSSEDITAIARIRNLRSLTTDPGAISSEKEATLQRALPDLLIGEMEGICDM